MKPPILYQYGDQFYCHNQDEYNLLVTGGSLVQARIVRIQPGSGMVRLAYELEGRKVLATVSGNEDAPDPTDEWLMDSADGQGGTTMSGGIGSTQFGQGTTAPTPESVNTPAVGAPKGDIAVDKSQPGSPDAHPHIPNRVMAAAKNPPNAWEVQRVLQTLIPGMWFTLREDTRNPDRPTVYLETIRLPKELRKHGLGSGIMQLLCEWADKTGTLLTLNLADPDREFGTTSRGRLIRFYRQFGFVPNKGRNKDFTLSVAMLRKPQTLLQPREAMERIAGGTYPGELIFRNEVTDSYKGQINGAVLVYDKADYKPNPETHVYEGDIIGQLQWQAFRDELLIAWIEVASQAQRQSIGLQMVAFLAQEMPEYRLEWGMTTPDGMALRRAWEQTHPPVASPVPLEDDALTPASDDSMDAPSYLAPLRRTTRGV